MQSEFDIWYDAVVKPKLQAIHDSGWFVGLFGTTDDAVSQYLYDNSDPRSHQFQFAEYKKCRNNKK